MVALGIGFFLVNVALYSFFVDQKLIHKIEATSAKNDTAQSMVMWTVTKQGLGTAYPTGAQYHQIGAAGVTYLGGNAYYLLQIQDWSTQPAPTPVANLTVPVIGN
jgi:hypothetical protein